MEINNFIQKYRSQSSGKIILPEKNQSKKFKGQLQDLLEEKDEEISGEEEQNISFSLSNCDDMNDLLDNFSQKSDEKIELKFESTTNEEGISLINDFLKESTRQILNNKKGFDDDIKKMSNEFYNDLINNFHNQKYIKKNYKPHYLDKTKNTNYMTKSESLTSDEQTKLKNDLIGQTFENKDKNTGLGKINSLKSKNSLIHDKISSSYIEEDEEEDNIIEIKKKKIVK